MRNEFWIGFVKQAFVGAHAVNKAVGVFKKYVHNNSSHSLPKKVIRGYRHDTIRNGVADSLAAWPVIEAAKRVFGKKKVYKHLSAFHRKALDADMVAGSIAGKIPFAKKLFTLKDQVHYGKGLTKEVSRPSLMAPLAKVRDVAAPIALGVESEKILNKLRKRDEDKRPS